MKKTLVTIIPALVCSILSIGLYHYFVGSSKTIYIAQNAKEEAARKIRADRYNMSPRQWAQYASNSGTPAGFPNDGGGDFPNLRYAAQLSAPSVVHIKCIMKPKSSKSFFDLGGGGGESSGSGVIVSEDGYILTNNHVVEDGEEITVTTHDGRTYNANVIGTDPSTDLGLIKIDNLEGNQLFPVEYGNSDLMEVGDWVLAVGNPFNLTSTVTAGIISAKGRNIDILEGEYSIESFIQTDAAVNPGNSGGALVDTYGRLVGINTAIMTRSGRYEGYSFAVPVNLARKVMTDLKEFGMVQRGFMGVFISDVTTEIAKENRLPSLEGVHLDKVKPDEAADKAGLKEGDVILKINGQKVKSSPEMQEIVAQYRPGQTLKVEYVRDGATYETNLILRNKNNATTLSPPREASLKKDNMSDAELLEKLGITLRSLTKDEETQLKVSGIMVEKVRDGSIIDKLNLEEGYVITHVNDTKVSTISEILEDIRVSGSSVTLDGIYKDYPDQGNYRYEFVK